MKQKLKHFLIKKNWYYPLRYSRVFRIYQFFFKQQDIAAHEREVAFYKSFLKNSELIFDIGAYDGHKTAAFLSLSKKVICCEPDEKSLQILKARFRHYSNRVIIKPVAVSHTIGKSTYYVHHSGSAFNTLSQDWLQLLEKDEQQKWNEKIKFTDSYLIETTTLDQLITEFGKPDFVKIDVEGYEIHVLQGLHEPIECISFEGLWPEYRKAMELCIDYLLALSADYRFNLSVHESLILAKWLPPSELIHYLEQSNLTHLEIIAKRQHDL